MNPLLLILLLVLALSAAGAAGARGLAKRSRTVTAASIKSMSVREVTHLLEAVAREPEPEYVMGAMCYAAMPMPDITEYVCPVCGEKTVYRDADHAFLLWQIDTARSLVSEIQAAGTLDVALDETGFCSFCSPDSVTPGLRLVVTYEDGTTVTPSVDVEDIRMLAGLLTGQLYYETSNESQSPLRPNLERLGDLLGIEIEVE
ncbi:MAG: hypothetical protein QUS11_08445 [Candidatus Fermentibacter sp.]|nr:hypothetical protein [Candidatus Fermentibacter sp.]